MRYLCLAYGRQEDWMALSDARREELLAQDQVLRARGAVLSPLGEPTVVRTPAGTPQTGTAPYAAAAAPLVGFGLIEADDLEEAVRLVAHTPCAVAGGAVEVRPLLSPEPPAVPDADG